MITGAWLTETHDRGGDTFMVLKLLKNHTLSLFIIAGFSLCLPAIAEIRLEKVRLDKDGSATPPGDVVQVFLVLHPGDNEVTVTVEALEAFGSEFEKVKSIRAMATAKNRFVNQDGLLVQKIITAINSDAKTIEEKTLSFVFPYSVFDLEPGKHGLYYNVHVDRPGSERETTGTRLTLIEIGDQTRNTIVRPGIRPERKLKKTTVLAYGVVEHELVSHEIEIEEEDKTKTAVSGPPKVSQVKITGGYTRSEAPFQVRRKVSSSADFVPKQKRIVYFATNRNIEDEKINGPDRFGGQLAEELNFGSCIVNIPVRNHKVGKVEQSSWWNHDPNDVFLVDALLKLEKENFFYGVSEDDVFLFVHGYKNSFKDALFRTAQVHHDIQFPGKPITFSWPSAATTIGYLHDEKMALASVDAMAELLITLAKGPNGNADPHRKIFVIAHSMGSRVLLYALNQLFVRGVFSEGEKPFEHIIFAAPDVDLSKFASFIPNAYELTEEVTYYYSHEDLALTASEKIHASNRAGLFPFFYKAMNTINVDNANSIFLTHGHTYFAAGDRVLLDLSLALVSGWKPDRRLPPLAKTKELKGFPGFAHYTFAFERR